MTRTIAICNQKGGVGKTTTTLNLGVGLARQGKRVLLVDADPQSDLTSSLGWNGDRLEKSLGRLMYLATQEYKPAVADTIIHHPEGVDLIPSKLIMKHNPDLKKFLRSTVVEDEDIFPKDFDPSMYRPYTQEEILVAVFEYDWLYMTVGMLFPWAYQELEKSSKSNSKKGSKKKKK